MQPISFDTPSATPPMTALAASSAILRDQTSETSRPKTSLLPGTPVSAKWAENRLSGVSGPEPCLRSQLDAKRTLRLCGSPCLRYATVATRRLGASPGAHKSLKRFFSASAIWPRGWSSPLLSKECDRAFNSSGLALSSSGGK